MAETRGQPLSMATLMGQEAVMKDLNSSELQHYARHLALPEIGKGGQLKLKKARVLLVGAGGLGSASSLYLAAAGVGRIGIVDFDIVDSSNLHRQILYGTSAVGERKVAIAKKRLQDVNPHIDIVTHDCKLDASNALEILGDYDIVADGTDNFSTRYLVNDACHLLKKPNVYASIFRFEGQVSVFDTRRGPCYRCLFPSPPPEGDIPSCAEGGVLGVLPGIAGTLQANEVIKLIANIGDPLVGRLLTFDALSLNFSALRFEKDPECALCGPNATITSLSDCGVSCEQVPTTTAAELAAFLSEVKLIDVRERHEWDQGHIEGAHFMPLSAFDETAVVLSPRDRIVVYCKSGARSRAAARMFRERGFDDVKSLAGGFVGWQAWCACLRAAGRLS